MIRSRKRDLLPLLAVLKSISANKRIVLISYLSDSIRDGLYELIVEVNSSKKIPLTLRQDLAKKLRPYRKHLYPMLHKKPPTSSKARLKRLVHLGGSPMKHIMKLAVPYLFNMIPK